MSKKAMYELRNMLCEELDELARKGDLGAGDLEIAHKLTDTIKNIDKIEMMEDDGYSRDGDYSHRYSRDGDIPATVIILAAATGRPICAALTAGAAPMLAAARITSAGTTAAPTAWSTCASRSTT